MGESKVKRKYFVFLVALFIAAIAADILCRTGPPPEPDYKGKRLTDWLAQYVANLPVDFLPSPPNYRATESIRAAARFEAEVAIRHINTNALPILVSMVAVNDSVLKKTLIKLAGQAHVPIHFSEHAVYCHTMAEAGFECLRSDASPAIPNLVKCLREASKINNTEICNTTVTCLTLIGPAAIPELLRLLADTNSNDTQWAESALRAIVPRLLYLLAQDETETNRSRAAIELAEIGGANQEIVQALVNATHDKSPLVRAAANGALGKLSTNLDPKTDRVR